MSATLLPTPVKIEGYEPLHGSTIRGKLALGFGLLLLGLTVGLCYVAWGRLPSGVARPTAPAPLISLFAIGCFGLPALLLLWVGVADLRQTRRVRQGRVLFPHEPWRWDYAWTGQRTGDIGLRMAGWGLIGWILGVGIVAPINYVALAERGDSFAVVKLLAVGLFDLFLLLSLGTVVYRVAVRFWHGSGTLTLSQFPLRLGESATLTLQPLAALNNVQELRCTLRCVEEPCEARQSHHAGGESARGRTVTKIGLQRYADELTLAGADLARNAPLPLTFELPDERSLRSQLSDWPPRHWELVVQGKRPGPDLEQRFLLPVY